MSFNIEIKARCPDLDLCENRVHLLSNSLDGTDYQTDTFYHVPAGRLKLRESSLYGNFLIPYIRTDQIGPKRSDYSLLPINDLSATKNILEKMFGVLIVVQKIRQIYLHENVRIHLDQVTDLGSFVELEAVINSENLVDENQDKLERLIKHLQIGKDDFISVAYADMLLSP